MHTPVILGIAGASGSGKSLLAKTLLTELASEKIRLISEDAYYKDYAHLSLEARLKINYDHPDTFDHDLLLSHLKALKAGKTLQMPQYDHSRYMRTQQTVMLKGEGIFILEGILLFSDPRLRALMSIRIFIDTPLDICLMRRLNRDIVQRGRTVDSVLTHYETTVRPMYLQFIEPSKHHADIIVPHGGENRIAIDMIKAKIRELY